MSVCRWLSEINPPPSADGDRQADPWKLWVSLPTGLIIYRKVGPLQEFRWYGRARGPRPHPQEGRRLLLEWARDEFGQVWLEEESDEE